MPLRGNSCRPTCRRNAVTSKLWREGLVRARLYITFRLTRRYVASCGGWYRLHCPTSRTRTYRPSALLPRGLTTRVAPDPPMMPELQGDSSDPLGPPWQRSGSIDLSSKEILVVPDRVTIDLHARTEYHQRNRGTSKRVTSERVVTDRSRRAACGKQRLRGGGQASRGCRR